MSSSATSFRVGEPICGILELRGKKEKLKGGKVKELSSMLVGWEFRSFQEWKTASPYTFIACSEVDPLAAYELPLLSGFGFPPRALLPNVVRGYVCDPTASPSLSCAPVIQTSGLIMMTPMLTRERVTIPGLTRERVMIPVLTWEKVKWSN